MKHILIPLVLLPFSVLANIQNFQCWDIHNETFSTDGSIYATRYIDKIPPPYGSSHYETAPNENFYREIIIVNEIHDDGYYYGNRYHDKKGVMYDDIKCKSK